MRFTPEMARWDPETFVRLVLTEWLRVAEVWVGANFVFGHDRSGNYSMLRLLGARYGFRAEKIDPVRYKEFVVSSTRVRRLIGEGRVDEAATLLGRHYFMDGVVVHGLQRGRTARVPDGEPRDRERADAAQRRLRDAGDARRRRLPGGHQHRRAADVPPAVGDGRSRPTCSTSSATCTAATMRVSFVQRIRDERTFDGVEALKAQITADCQYARHLFAQLSL